MTWTRTERGYTAGRFEIVRHQERRASKRGGSSSVHETVWELLMDGRIVGFADDKLTDAKARAERIATEAA